MDREIKFSLISFVLKELDQSRWYYGKIVIQKILYFLQESKNVDLGYRFTFYHYGPYSEGLDQDVRLMELNDLLTSTLDPKGIGYAMHLNQNKADEYIKNSSEYIKKHEKKIEKVLNDFASENPSPLELYATIHFIYKDLKKQNGKSDIKQKVVDIVKKMKPKFTLPFISKSYDKLVKLKYIK